MTHAHSYDPNDPRQPTVPLYARERQVPPSLAFNVSFCIEVGEYPPRREHVSKGILAENELDAIWQVRSYARSCGWYLVGDVSVEPVTRLG